ncbi:MAG: hypothetical protein IPP34_19630 [Bacteroidetes bacterium]|nr:hypothetical protein [Bacteroidota bacterium]
MSGLADSLPIEVTTIRSCRFGYYLLAVWSPAVESFSSNVNSIFKRKIPYNPDTVCVAKIQQPFMLCGIRIDAGNDRGCEQ